MADVGGTDRRDGRAVQRRRGLALAGSVVLGLTAAVAGISGFFDGQLARSDLGSWHVAGQIAYVVVAWATVVVAGLRVAALRRSRALLSR